jgi:hypothetical protein
VQANFGPTVGVHTGVRLLRYRKGGPVFIQLEQLTEVFTIAKTTLRDAMQEFEDGYYVEDRPDVLQVLRQHGFVGGCASKVVILRIAFAEQLLRTFDVDQHARDVLRSLASTTPPPRPPPSATKTPARCVGDSGPIPHCQALANRVASRTTTPIAHIWPTPAPGANVGEQAPMRTCNASTMCCHSN